MKNRILGSILINLGAFLLIFFKLVYAFLIFGIKKLGFFGIYLTFIFLICYVLSINFVFFFKKIIISVMNILFKDIIIYKNNNKN
jgi:hypothetical protein